MIATEERSHLKKGVWSCAILVSGRKKYKGRRLQDLPIATGHKSKRNEPPCRGYGFVPKTGPGALTQKGPISGRKEGEEEDHTGLCRLYQSRTWCSGEEPRTGKSFGKGQKKGCKF